MYSLLWIFYGEVNTFSLRNGTDIFEVMIILPMFASTGASDMEK